MQAERITSDVAKGILDIIWIDGSTQQFGHAYLRRQCKCADCKALRLRTQVPPAVSGGVRIIAIRPVGSYGVQLVFDDGHDRGIYPWVYLKTLTEEATLEAAQH